MELSLERPLLFFDIESTGLNIVNDCIVELSFVKVFPDGHHEVKTWRVCPWDYTLRKQHPINPEASQVNGIKDEDVAKEKKFIELPLYGATQPQGRIPFLLRRRGFRERPFSRG